MQREAGHVFFREGEETDAVLLIKKGHLRVLVGKPSRIVAIRRSGELVGEMGAIRGKPRSATVVAHDDVVVLHIPAQHFLDVLYENPRTLHALLVESEERTEQATRKIVDSDLAAERRLAKALLELVEDGVADRVDGVLTARFAQADLASLTGMSLESVKKVTKLFRDNAIVDTGRGQVRILDTATLEEVAAGNRTTSR
nr:Crp/Fnr family transcriptional regulator [Kibdelosporangium phytohabitans]